MMNFYKTTKVLVLLSIISSQFTVIASRPDTESIGQRYKRLARNSLQPSPPGAEEISGETIINDDLIRTPNIPNGKLLQLSPKERQKLKSIYGVDSFRTHAEDLSLAKTIGQDQTVSEHIPWDGTDEAVTGVDQDIIDEALLNSLSEEGTVAEINADQTEEQKRLLDPTIAKNLLQSLLNRFDDSGESKNFGSQQRETDSGVPSTQGHCNLHGLWLSTVAGAAIELIPVQQEGHIEIRTKIFDLPDNPDTGLITSQWTGKGVISSESPTTITIVFQEHLTEPKQNGENGIQESEIELPVSLPKTAVFVGQCLICENSPVLQGTWVVFPNTQSCLQSANEFIKSHPENRTPVTADTLYLLQ